MAHLIPFAGRNYSGPVDQNLCWQSHYVYLIDNHRLALWCWQQQIDLQQEPHNLIHIDRHYDALGANLAAHLNVLPDLRHISATEYLDASVSFSSATLDKISLFRWDNYLSIYLAAYAEKLGCLRCLTHNDGDKPVFGRLLESPPYDLPSNLHYWLEKGKWIVNIDLDYFFCAGPEEQTGAFLPLFSDDYIKTTFTALRKAMDEDLVSAVTICLTPSNFTPGWEDCLRLSRTIFDILGVEHPDV